VIDTSITDFLAAHPKTAIVIFPQTFPACNAQERAASGWSLLICFNKQRHRFGV
jgi:hypothetical protein